MRICGTKLSITLDYPKEQMKPWIDVRESWYSLNFPAGLEIKSFLTTKPFRLKGGAVKCRGWVLGHI